MDEQGNTMTRGDAMLLYNASAAELIFALEGYYKFTFTFRARNASVVVSAGCGGNSEDIYRYTPPLGPFKGPPSFDALCERYHRVTITDATNPERHYEHYE